MGNQLANMGVITRRGALRGLMTREDPVSVNLIPTQRNPVAFFETGSEYAALYGPKAYVATTSTQYGNGVIRGARLFIAHGKEAFHELRMGIWGNRLNSQSNNYSIPGLLNSIQIRYDQYGDGERRPVVNFNHFPNPSDNFGSVLYALDEARTKDVLGARMVCFYDPIVAHSALEAIFTGGVIYPRHTISRYFIFTDSSGNKRAVDFGLSMVTNGKPQVMFKDLVEGESLWKSAEDEPVLATVTEINDIFAGGSTEIQVYRIKLSQTATLVFKREDNSFYFESNDPKEGLSAFG